MSIQTLRPNGTDTFTGTVVGAATAHAALSDDSDASYVVLDGGELVENQYTDEHGRANGGS